MHKSYTCPTCNTMYQPSIPSEVLAHKRACEAHTLGVLWRSGGSVSGNDRKAPRCSPPAADALTQPRQQNAKARRGGVDSDPSGRVVRPSPSHPSAALVKSIVDQEMGFVDDALDPPGLVTYLYISGGGRVVGFLTVHPLRSCYLLWDGGEDRGGQEAMERSNVPLPCRLGVRQVWTHTSFRSMGVVTHLLERARSEAIYGAVVGKEEVAFSSPTEDGARLARKWGGERQGSTTAKSNKRTPQRPHIGPFPLWISFV